MKMGFRCYHEIKFQVQLYVLCSTKNLFSICVEVELQQNIVVIDSRVVMKLALLCGQKQFFDIYGHQH